MWSVEHKQFSMHKVFTFSLLLLTAAVNAQSLDRQILGTSGQQYETAAANSWSDLPIHFLTAPSSVGAEQRFGGSAFLFATNAPWCDGSELLGGGEKHPYGSTEFLPVGRIHPTETYLRCALMQTNIKKNNKN